MNDFVVHRVVVAFDPVGENKSSIELAAQLAAWWDVALRGVFVEDETLNSSRGAAFCAACWAERRRIPGIR